MHDENDDMECYETRIPVVERLPIVEPTNRHVLAPVAVFTGHVFSGGEACLFPLLGGVAEGNGEVGIGVVWLLLFTKDKRRRQGGAIQHKNKQIISSIPSTII